MECKGKDLGWGRLTEENLASVLKIHAAEAELTRRTPYLARARGSNLLAHVMHSIEQAATGTAVPGALGNPGDKVLLVSCHDTNLSNISGILRLSWHLTGYVPDETPPGGALIFSLWWDGDSKQYIVRAQFVAQTLDQMRNSASLTISSPPAQQDVAIPGCSAGSQSDKCAWPLFKTVVERGIDPQFISLDTVSSETR